LNHAAALTPTNLWVRALERQEGVNNIRALRNEASYQMLRNGFVILLAALAVFASLLVFFDV
jgi:hypothetical protein